MHLLSGTALLKGNHSQSIPRAKRFIDIIFCVIGFPVLAICTFLVSIVMRFVSPGPIFFTQERIGLRGRRFKIYKFRTMRVAADTTLHQQYFTNLVTSNAPMVKLDARGDSRLIPGGWLLRASGLDELPQLINVFKGEMSMVGPRPCLPSEYENYTPEQRKRFDASPGLTGLWQVSGKNKTTFNEMIRLDIKYAETRTIWLDFYIVFMTTPTLIQQIFETRAGRKRAASGSHQGATVFPLATQPDRTLKN